MSALSRFASPATLEEAIAVAKYASDDAAHCSTWDLVEAALDDAALTTAILAVAEHICDLRSRRPTGS